MVNSRHLFLYFSLFNTVDRKWMFYIKGCRWLDTNCGPLVWKQPLSHNHCPITILTLSPFQSCTSTHSWTQWQTLSWRWLLKRVSAWVAIMCCCLSPPPLSQFCGHTRKFCSILFFFLLFKKQEEEKCCREDLGLVFLTVHSHSKLESFLTSRQEEE